MFIRSKTFNSIEVQLVNWIASLVQSKDFPETRPGPIVDRLFRRNDGRRVASGQITNYYDSNVSSRWRVSGR